MNQKQRQRTVCQGEIETHGEEHKEQKRLRERLREKERTEIIAGVEN